MNELKLEKILSEKENLERILENLSEGIIGREPRMLQVYRQIRDLATNDYPVHIMGETGTGKELVANAIHNESRRGGRPWKKGRMP